MLIEFESCYRAVASRDRRFDGRFYTAVTSTGIYCRPSCPARTPSRSSVRFYRHAAAAQDAGFRPCRRCRPEASPGAPGWDVSADLARRALALIDEGEVDRTGVTGLARRLAVSERQLRRVMCSELGAPPVAIARTRRAHLARRLLDDTSLPISRIAFAAGFSSIRQFNAHMLETFGRSPTELRRSGGGPDGCGREHASAPITLRLGFRPPLAVAPLLAFLRAHAVPGVEEVTATSYRRVVVDGGRTGILELLPRDDHVLLRLEVTDSPSIGGVVARARRLLDLDADVHAAERVLARDPLLAPLLARHPGLRLPGSFDGFETAVFAILGQQVSTAAARTLAGRLVAAAATPLPAAAGTLTAAFPGPEAVAEAPLETLGMPARRAATVRALAVAVADGVIALDGGQDEDETLAALRRIEGVGDWTAAVIALRVLGHPDSLPAGDLALRRALTRSGGPPSPAALREKAQAWRPWRSYACIHLWTHYTEEARDERAASRDDDDARRPPEPARA
jgi:AraC family transcriptional regulator of adaptative response / DNA-3-methyladenine glycosylase II